MRFWYSMRIVDRKYIVGCYNNTLLEVNSGDISLDMSIAQRVCASLNDVDAKRIKDGKPLHEYPVLARYGNYKSKSFEMG